MGVLFRPQWSPQAESSWWPNVVPGYTHIFAGLSCIVSAWMVLIVILYSTHLPYCTSLSGIFAHPSSLCPLFLIVRVSAEEDHGQNCHCGNDWQESCLTRWRSGQPIQRLVIGRREWPRKQQHRKSQFGRLASNCNDCEGVKHSFHCAIINGKHTLPRLA